MKKHLLLLSNLLLAANIYAQIPNPSFENWSAGDPVGWYTGNGPYEFVSQVNTAHQGSSAARLNVIDVYGFAFSAPFSLGTNGTGVHTASAPIAVHGWYMMNAVNGDYELVSIGMLQNNAYTGAGYVQLGNSSVYKEFVANMFYYSGVPNGDSLIILCLMSNDSAGIPHIGSYFIMDDLSFGALSGIGDLNNGTLAGIESITPNPGSDVAQIIYNIRESGNTNLCIYSMDGKMVQQLVNENQSPGRYKAIADITELHAGTYICRLTTGVFTNVSKLVVER
ncbi:MAG TPA: T9SS type A sorting domain-containing protein [Chitinophagales bacterium]|nr:T9SS type A sorting domain-containing protein [Chitinophagales bacterium]